MMQAASLLVIPLMSTIGHSSDTSMMPTLPRSPRISATWVISRASSPPGSGAVTPGAAGCSLSCARRGNSISPVAPDPAPFDMNCHHFTAGIRWRFSEAFPINLNISGGCSYSTPVGGNSVIIVGAAGARLLLAIDVEPIKCGPSDLERSR